MSSQKKNNVESSASLLGSSLGPTYIKAGGFDTGIQSSGFSSQTGTTAAGVPQVSQVTHLTQNFRRNVSESKQEVVSITYEEIGLFPRSFSRVLDRFLKQVFSDVENLVIQEYRFYRYLFLTTFKSLLILFFVPFFVNFLAKNYIVRPLTEYFWNTKQSEIFLNVYQQKRAFAELKDFEEKLYFESLIYPKSPERTTPTGEALEQVYLVPHLTKAPALEIAPLLKSSKETKLLALGLEPKPVSKVSSKNLVNLRRPGLQEFNSILVETTNVTLNDKTFVGLMGGTVNNELKNFNDNPSFLTNEGKKNLSSSSNEFSINPLNKGNFISVSDEKTESLINSYTLKSSLFVYQTREADKNIQQRYQEKTIELAQRYNDQSIEAIANFFADLISLLTLFYLLYALEIQINITKSFLLEVFFGLDDSKKSLLILLVTDLLVGYHSSNLWELFFEFLFNHYGLPESQTGIFLLVATLPVLLDVLFKYLIFRHLNRSSPATVATYRAMIE